MDDQHLGAALRAIRLRHAWTQQAVALESGVSRATVSRIERGHVSELSVGMLRRVAGALEVRIDIAPRWRGGELDRLLGARHSAMLEQLARRLSELPAWDHAAEVTYSIYGERGAIDTMAWHRARRMLLVIEIKTQIMDVQALLGQADRYRRLAPSIGRARGWDPSSVSCWIVVADTRANRRRLAAHAHVLRSTFPADGRTVRSWLRDPREPIAVLSFLSNDRPRNASQVGGACSRVPRRLGTKG